MRFVNKMGLFGHRNLSLEGKSWAIQILPNFYANVGSYELAIDRDGIRIFTPKRTAAYTRGAGFSHQKYEV